jgi:hypothetical protein
MYLTMHSYKRSEHHAASLTNSVPSTGAPLQLEASAAPDPLSATRTYFSMMISDIMANSFFLILLGSKDVERAKMFGIHTDDKNLGQLFIGKTPIIIDGIVMS